MSILSTLRKIRACEGEAAAQLVFEKALEETRQQCRAEAEDINNRLYNQREAWLEICGKVKEIIGDFDHVNDDAIKTLSVINDLLDDAFASDIVAFVNAIRNSGLDKGEGV